jgi:hypothetical protein
MSFADLPTLADLQARPRAVRKDRMPSRMDTKAQADQDDAKLLRRLALDVRARDLGICRVCGVQTVPTLELDPKRSECHHIVSRTCKVTRYDIRNCLHLCLACHQKVTHHKLFVVGTAAQVFRVGKGITAKTYLDATCNLQFKEKRP